MVKTSSPVRESTPLLYGTDSVQVPTRAAPSDTSRTQSRRWKFAASGAALLCAGALVSSKLHMNGSSSSSPSLDRIMDSGVSLNKQPVKALDGETPVDPVTADFFKSMKAFKNENVDPCIDFYEYACGGWLAENEIPSDGATIDSAFYVVGEDNKKIIRKIIDAKPPVISEFYASCLSAPEVDEDAVTYVSKIIGTIKQLNSTTALLSYAGELDQSYGISSFFSVGVGADPQDPTTNVLQLSQGGLTLPSREYYLEATKKEQYAALFTKYVSDLFVARGLNGTHEHNVSAFADAVFETETKLAEISLTNAELRDPWTTNNAFTFTSIEAKFPLLAAYLDGVSKQEPFPKTHAIISTPAFFTKQADVLESIDTQQLKQYLSFHVIDSFGATLGERFRRASHDFHGTVRGSGSLPTREKFCVDTTTTYLGAFLGEFYMEAVFGPDAQKSAKKLVQEIESSMKRLLKTEEWLDKVTYDAAVAKLERVRNYIGGPTDVPDLPFELSANDFFDNVVSLLQLSASQTIQSVGEPVDATKWDMFPSTVNAYYDPSANKMVFPAAILQPPFYSADKFPTAANYARIGMVMGHELSHGFDDQGRNYDGNGTLRKWWSASVSDDFTARAQCLAAQYSSFPVVTEDGVLLGNVNGELTLGENIADNGGIHLAYGAYKLSQQSEEGEGGDDEPTAVVVVKPTKEKKKPEDEKDDEDDDEADKKQKSKETDAKKPAKTGDDDDEKKEKKLVKDKDDEKKKSKSEDKDDDKDDDKKSTKVVEKKKKDKKVAKKDEEDDKEDDKKSTKEKSKKDDDDKEDDKKKTKKSKDDDNDKEDDKKSSKKSKKDDEEDEKKSKKFKSKKDVKDEDEDKKHKSKKKGEDEKHKSKKDDEEDEKKSNKSKSKKHDDEEDEEDKHSKKYHDDKDEGKHSKKHKSKHDEDEDGENDKHFKHKSKKHHDVDECDDCDDKKHHHGDDDEGKHSKRHRHYGDDKDEDKHKSKKHDDDGCDDCDDKKHSKKHRHEDEEDDCDDCRDEKKHKKHLRREMALSTFQLSVQMTAVGTESESLTSDIKDDRLFFTAFAQNWCEKRAPAYAELLRATDPHSPGRWRVNGPLKNFDKFATAFQCKLGTPMNPDKKCLVW